MGIISILKGLTVFFFYLGWLESRTQLFEIGMTGGEVSDSKVSRVEREFQRKS